MSETCTAGHRCWDSGVKGERRRLLREVCARCGEMRALHGANHPHDTGERCSGFLSPKRKDTP